MLDRPFSTLNTNQFREQVCGSSLPPQLLASHFEQSPFFCSQNPPWKTWAPQPQQYSSGVYNYCCCPQIPPTTTNFCNNPSVVFTFQPQPPPRPCFSAPFQTSSQQQQFIVPPSNFQLEMMRFQQLRMNEIENRNAVEQFCRQFQANFPPFQFKFYKDYGTLHPDLVDSGSCKLRDSGNQTNFCCENCQPVKTSRESSGESVGVATENSDEKCDETDVQKDEDREKSAGAAGADGIENKSNKDEEKKKEEETEKKK